MSVNLPRPRPLALAGADAHFNAHHSPPGAFATLTLGFPGARGGLGIELEGPARHSVFVGATSADGDRVEMLPFFGDLDDEQTRFDVELAGGSGGLAAPREMPVRYREFGATVDTWYAADLTFSLYSPCPRLPDPDTAPPQLTALAVLPAILGELTLDNTAGAHPRRLFLGYQGPDPAASMRRLVDEEGKPALGGGTAGIGQGRSTAIATDTLGVVAGVGFDVAQILADGAAGRNEAFGLGRVALLHVEVPAGQSTTVRFAVCFHRGGPVTAGRETRYLYHRYYSSVEDVARTALQRFDDLAAAWWRDGAEIDDDRLSPDRRFQLAHAVRSYLGNTQLLDDGGRAVWVVNEGEYRMMNTLDLTVDHAFYESARHPWTLRNVLDHHLVRYAYRDELHAPDGRTAAGGLAFTHDMGVANVFAPAGRSAYEREGLRGCFSVMAHEELLNWTLSAAVYLAATGDRTWREERRPVFADILESLLRRDDPDPRRRTGVMGWDSARTGDGWEITTYDSLDPSLGRARGSLYLAVKAWAAYVCLERVLTDLGDAARAAVAAAQARSAADTVLSRVRPDGTLPAVVDGDDVPGHVIPAVEGLVYAHLAGRPDALRPTGPYADLVAALRRHLTAVLAPGVCLFDDGGWRLSSRSGNSWLSKIYLAQYVAEAVLGLDLGPAGAWADAAHGRWLRDPRNAEYCWSDQMHAGVARGSRYYPRGVTAILWSRAVSA